MKILIDTNVLVSAVFRGGTPLRLVNWVLAEETCIWLVSIEILKEYRRLITDPRLQIAVTAIEHWLEITDEATYLVEPDLQFKLEELRDQKDLVWLQCAMAGGADCLITGDKDLLAIKELVPFKILSPGEFLQSFQ